MIPVILAEASVSIPLDVVLWTAGAMVALIGSLLTLIYNLIRGKIKEAADKADAVDKKLHTDVNGIYARIEAERLERVGKHDELARRLGEDQEKTREKVIDLNETVAGIGSVYVTRNEYVQHQVLNHQQRKP